MLLEGVRIESMAVPAKPNSRTDLATGNSTRHVPWSEQPSGQSRMEQSWHHHHPHDENNETDAPPTCLSTIVSFNKDTQQQQQWPVTKRLEIHTCSQNRQAPGAIECRLSPRKQANSHSDKTHLANERRCALTVPKAVANAVRTPRLFVTARDLASIAKVHFVVVRLVATGKAGRRK